MEHKFPKLPKLNKFYILKGYFLKKDRGRRDFSSSFLLLLLEMMPYMSIEYNPEYIHHKSPQLASTLGEVVFGVEDGMVSTLGAVTGIAVATQNHFTAVLSGFVIIAVESISMGVGSYLSNKSKREVDERKLFEEKTELEKFPEDEKQELVDMYIEDGWSKELAEKMSEEASKNKKFFLKEMAYRELQVIPESLEHPLRNGLLMGSSYILGGLIPVLPYLVLPLGTAIIISIIITLLGLFILGTVTTKFTKRKWWKAGLEMLGLASAAAIIGYAVGQAVDYFWLK